MATFKVNIWPIVAHIFRASLDPADYRQPVNTNGNKTEHC